MRDSGRRDDGSAHRRRRGARSTTVADSMTSSKTTAAASSSCAEPNAQLEGPARVRDLEINMKSRRRFGRTPFLVVVRPRKVPAASGGARTRCRAGASAEAAAARRREVLTSTNTGSCRARLRTRGGAAGPRRSQGERRRRPATSPIDDEAGAVLCLLVGLVVVEGIPHSAKTSCRFGVAQHRLAAEPATRADDDKARGARANGPGAHRERVGLG